ncbi:MAG: hypothetical protein E6Q97_19690, partial [Desulfurellales bacterium]
MSFIILDLDNCIADDQWRIPRINWQHKDPMRRYHDYHSLSGFDRAGNKDLFHKTKHDIIILTARPVHYAPITMEWLNRQHIKPFALIMRNNDDHSPSVDLKRKQMGWLTHLYGVDVKDIVCAYDDRMDVVEMYLNHGIIAAVRAIHDTCAYTNPNKEQSNADSGQSDGENAGDVLGAQADVRTELPDHRQSLGA